MWLVKLVVVLAGVYGAVVALMYLAQTWLLFPTRLAEMGRVALPAGAERLEVTTPDGERLVGLHLPAAREAGGERLVILGFGGNAWPADDLALLLRTLYPEADIVAFQYRGYAPSTGRPSAAALLADAPLLHDHVARTLAPARIVAVGISIGGAVAARLAQQRPLAGLILVSPFDSLARLASGHYPWAPVGPLLRHRMPTVEFVAGLATPTALIAAERDAIVPPRRTAPLRRAIPNLVFDRTIADAGHNDLFHRPAFAAAMHDALAAIAAAR